MRKILDILTSLRLTVILLALALGLVFIGTIAQVKLGLYIVQEQFFNSYFVWWKPENGNFKLPATIAALHFSSGHERCFPSRDRGAAGVPC